MQLERQELMRLVDTSPMKKDWHEYCAKLETRPDTRFWPCALLAGFLAGEVTPPVDVLVKDVDFVDKQELVLRVKMAVKAGGGPLVGKGRDPDRYNEDELRSHLRANRFIITQPREAQADGVPDGDGKSGPLVTTGVLGEGGKGGKAPIKGFTGGTWKGPGEVKDSAEGGEGGEGGEGPPASALARGQKRPREEELGAAEVEEGAIFISPGRLAVLTTLVARGLARQAQQEVPREALLASVNEGLAEGEPAYGLDEFAAGLDSLEAQNKVMVLESGAVISIG